MATRAKHYPEIDRTELAAKIRIDRGYLTNILNGIRKAPLHIAVAIFKETGVKLGPLAGKTPAQVRALKEAATLLASAA